MIIPNRSIAAVESATAWIEGHRRQTLGIAWLLVCLLAFLDWSFEPNLSLGLLYFFPILLASIVFTPAEVLFFAAGCALVREVFSPFRFEPGYGLRLSLTFAAFSAFGLLISEVNRNRRLAEERLRHERKYSRLQSEADRQIKALMEASPLSILITDGTGKILRYNSACRKFPGVGKTSKTENIFAYLTGLKTLLPAPAAGEAHNHLELEAAGESADGEAFLAHVWLTMYRAGPELDPDLEPGELRIAFVLWDASEDVRGRELAHSESLDATARVLLASFSHEVRNLSVAAGALAGRLTSLPGAEEDVRALSTVIGNLTDFAATGLKLGSGRALSVVDLAATMDQVHVTIRPIFEEANVRLNWRLSNHLPIVYAGHGSLMQVFLNLAANSARALKENSDGEVNVEAAWDANTVAIRFRDNGTGVSAPENLFQPFQSASGGAGLGLYVSRAMLRSFGGDLQYEPGPGAIFVVRLVRAPEEHYADTVTSD